MIDATSTLSSARRLGTQRRLANDSHSRLHGNDNSTFVCA